jgi:hypothetical protein
MAINVAFFTATSLIAIVPLSEFRTPTLIPVPLAAPAAGAVVGAGFAAAAGAVGAAGAGVLHAASNPATDAPSTAPVEARRNPRRLKELGNIAQRYLPSSTKTSALLPATGHLISDEVPNTLPSMATKRVMQ